MVCAAPTGLFRIHQDFPTLTRGAKVCRRFAAVNGSASVLVLDSPCHRPPLQCSILRIIKGDYLLHISFIGGVFPQAMLLVTPELMDAQATSVAVL